MSSVVDDAWPRHPSAVVHVARVAADALVRGDLITAHAWLEGTLASTGGKAFYARRSAARQAYDAMIELLSGRIPAITPRRRARRKAA